MTIEELRQCSKWVGKKPLEILKHVREAGGWSRVFPRRSELVFEAIHKWVPVPIPAVRDTSVFPEWASRIRNYLQRDADFAQATVGSGRAIEVTGDQGSIARFHSPATASRPHTDSQWCPHLRTLRTRVLGRVQ